MPNRAESLGKVLREGSVEPASAVWAGPVVLDLLALPRETLEPEPHRRDCDQVLCAPGLGLGVGLGVVGIGVRIIR